MSEEITHEATEEAEAPQIDPFWEHHDELLGLLLSVNQKLSDAGTGIMGFFLLLYVALAVILFFDLGAGYDYPLHRYDSWVTYAAGLVVVFIVAGYLSGLQEKLTYLRQKGRIEQALLKRGISRHLLIAKIEKSPGLSLKNVAKNLKAKS
ncbi:hypothetical protein [Endothiovibrio diazotrophicus]